jgi:hypothetical protein
MLAPVLSVAGGGFFEQKQALEALPNHNRTGTRLVTDPLRMPTLSRAKEPRKGFFLPRLNSHHPSFLFA